MIRLIGGYYIKAEQYGYSLCKGEPKKTYKKDGKPTYAYNVKGYYGSVAQAIEGCRRELVHERFQSGSYGLTEAVKAIREISRDVMEALKDVDA